MKRKWPLLVVLTGFCFSPILAQEQAPASDRVPAFWGIRLVNLPTTHTLAKGEFLFQISHRFVQPVRSGYDSFYGLDGPSIIFLGFGFGISDRLGVSIGRTNNAKTVELGLHWLAFDQDGGHGLPFSAVLHAGGSLVTESRPDRKVFSSENFSLNIQLSLSRRLTDRLSLLVVPCYSTKAGHSNSGRRGTLGLGIGGRFMFLEDVSVIAEWIPVLSGYKAEANGWGIGLEMKIGGHVFHFFALNSYGLTADQFVSGGDLMPGKGDFRLGFNIFRSF